MLNFISSGFSSSAVWNKNCLWPKSVGDGSVFGHSILGAALTASRAAAGPFSGRRALIAASSGRAVTGAAATCGALNGRVSRADTLSACVAAGTGHGYGRSAILPSFGADYIC